jgi:diadenylate cyclase
MTYYAWIWWKVLAEICLLWLSFYYLLTFIKGTRALSVLKGLALLGVILFAAQVLGFKVISWIMTKLLAIWVLAIIVIFQPELRRGLAQIGEIGIYSKKERVIDEIARSVDILSKKKIGAIIAVEREIGLRHFVESGVQLDSRVTSELINTVFMPNTPLHDGGIIIREGRIVAAGCLFPLTQDINLSKSLGTRHRAAIGLTEETDAICIVVSEETGVISLAIGGRLTRNLDKDALIRVLNNIYKPHGK